MLDMKQRKGSNIVGFSPKFASPVFSWFSDVSFAIEFRSWQQSASTNQRSGLSGPAAHCQPGPQETLLFVFRGPDVMLTHLAEQAGLGGALCVRPSGLIFPRLQVSSEVNYMCCDSVRSNENCALGPILSIQANGQLSDPTATRPPLLFPILRARSTWCWITAHLRQKKQSHPPPPPSAPRVNTT